MTAVAPEPHLFGPACRRKRVLIKDEGRLPQRRAKNALPLCRCGKAIRGGHNALAHAGIAGIVPSPVNRSFSGLPCADPFFLPSFIAMA